MDEQQGTIDPAKQENAQIVSLQRSEDQEIQERHNAIAVICAQLSTPATAFNAESTCSSVMEYIGKYKRWFYSDISDYLFRCTEKEIASFLSNLDTLQSYVYAKRRDATDEEKAAADSVVTVIDKLYDHSNLAQKQNISLHDSDETFSSRFDKNLIPFKATFAHEMNMQFISLIAIFTALSFIVFGGISSLNNIFQNAAHIPILELVIVGCIWSLCISNLVFAFMYFVSKVAGIPIKTSNHPNAQLSQKYPLWVWSNYVLLLILAIACWLYFIDYANAGGWLLNISKKYSMLVSISGIAIIGILFGVFAWNLLHAKEPNDN